MQLTFSMCPVTKRKCCLS